MGRRPDYSENVQDLDDYIVNWVYEKDQNPPNSEAE